MFAAVRVRRSATRCAAWARTVDALVPVGRVARPQGRRCSSRSLRQVFNRLISQGEEGAVLEAIVHARRSGELVVESARVAALRACATVAFRGPEAKVGARAALDDVLAFSAAAKTARERIAAASALAATGDVAKAVATVAGAHLAELGSSSPTDVAIVLHAACMERIEASISDDLLRGLLAWPGLPDARTKNLAGALLRVLVLRGMDRHAASLYEAVVEASVVLSPWASSTGAAAAARALPWPTARRLLHAGLLAGDPPAVVHLAEDQAAAVVHACAEREGAHRRERRERLDLAARLFARSLAHAVGGATGPPLRAHVAAAGTWAALPEDVLASSAASFCPADGGPCAPLLSPEIVRAMQPLGGPAAAAPVGAAAADDSWEASGALPLLPDSLYSSDPPGGGGAGALPARPSLPLGRAAAEPSPAAGRGHLRAATSLLRAARRTGNWRVAQDVISLCEAAGVRGDDAFVAAAAYACARPCLLARAEKLTAATCAARPTAEGAPGSAAGAQALLRARARVAARMPPAAAAAELDALLTAREDGNGAAGPPDAALGAALLRLCCAARRDALPLLARLLPPPGDGAVGAPDAHLAREALAAAVRSPPAVGAAESPLRRLWRAWQLLAHALGPAAPDVLHAASRNALGDGAPLSDGWWPRLRPRWPAAAPAAPPSGPRPRGGADAGALPPLPPRLVADALDRAASVEAEDDTSDAAAGTAGDPLGDAALAVALTAALPIKQATAAWLVAAVGAAGSDGARAVAEALAACRAGVDAASGAPAAAADRKPWAANPRPPALASALASLSGACLHALVSAANAAGRALPACAVEEGLRRAALASGAAAPTGARPAAQATATLSEALHCARLAAPSRPRLLLTASSAGRPSDCPARAMGRGGQGLEDTVRAAAAVARRGGGRQRGGRGPARGEDPRPAVHSVVHAVHVGTYAGAWQVAAAVEEALRGREAIVARRVGAKAFARAGLRVVADVPLWMLSADPMALCIVQREIATALEQWPRLPPTTCHPVPVSVNTDPRRPAQHVSVAVLLPAASAGRWALAMGRPAQRKGPGRGRREQAGL